jgi:hypothetical protein
MSPRLRRGIIACDPAHPASSALRASDGSSNQDCTLEAMRTQGGFSFFLGVAHCDMNDSSERRATAWASDRRTRDAPPAYARCAVDCMGSANVSEAVEAAVANLLGQSAPLTIFTSPARKTFGEKLLMRLIRRAPRAGI